MEKITRISLTAAVLSTFELAGGDIASVLEPEVTVSAVQGNSIESNFYAGSGYSDMKIKNDTLDTDITGNALLVFAGYKFYEHLALEGRYTFTTGDLNDNGIKKGWEISNIALYFKPQYRINKFTAYGLLGY